LKNKRLSQKIAELSLFTTFLIVALHVHADFVPGSGAYFFYTVLRGLAAIAVPYFCLVSGYFLAVHMGEKGWWGSALRKRVHSLLIPFFFWNVAAWLFYFAFHHLAALKGISFGDGYVQGITPGRVAAWLGFDPFDYPMHGHYWYVRMLWVFVLVSPAFVICRRSLLPVCGLLIALLVFNRIQVPDAPWSFFWEWTFPIRCLFFLAVGVYLSNHQVTPLHTSRRTGLIALLFGIAMLVLLGCGVALPPEAGLLMTLCLLLGVWDLWPVMGLPSLLLSCAFPIFTIHWFVTRLVQIILKALHQYDNTRSSFPIYFASLLAAWLVSTFLALALRRFLPRLSRLIFGR